ncbi:hypothetical protein D3C72_1934670 [compost metagenome]
MVVPAEGQPRITQRLAHFLEALAEGEPAAGIARAHVGQQIGAVDRLDAEQLGDFQRAGRIAFQKVETEMAGRHGQPVAVEIGAQGVEARVIEGGIHGAIAFDMGVSGFGEERIDIGEGLEIAGAVKLETEFGHGSFLLFRTCGAGPP